MPPNTQPWAPYAVGNPSTRTNWNEPACTPFTSISHVTHIENAISILRLGKVLPQLVYDESILNDDRILVNWLSPNYWSPGFRYGNVMFSFDFKALIAGMRIYWVETMSAYNPTALRLLITGQDRSSDDRLMPYNPEDRTGPWWYDRGSETHFRNGNYTLEFMLEDELELGAAQTVSLVNHHNDFCCMDYAKCPDKGMNSTRAGSIFGAGVVIHGIDCQLLPFDEGCHHELAHGVLQHYHSNNHNNFVGVTTTPAEEDALARSWLSACYFRRVEDQRTIKQLFSSRETFVRAVGRLLTASFGAEKLPQLHFPEEA